MSDFALTAVTGRMNTPKFRTVGTNETLKAVFGVAVNRYRKNSEGEFDQRTVWVDCEAWGRIAEQVQKFGGKGVRVSFQGDNDSETYEKDGQDVTHKFVVVRQISIFNNNSPETADEDAEPAATTTSRPF